MKRRRKVQTDEDLQRRFDAFVKSSIRNIAWEVLDAYVTKMNKSREVYIDDFEDLVAPEKTPDVEKIEVPLGSSMLLCESEALADGIRELSERHRRVLECAFVLDLPNEAAAELMNLEEKSIRNYKSEACRILRMYMEGRRDV